MTPGDHTRLGAPARNALARAAEESARHGHARVEAAHLLIALRLGPDSEVAAVLRDAGVVSVRHARHALTELLPAGKGTGNSRSLAPELVLVLNAVRGDRDSASALCDALLSMDNTATRLLGILGVDQRTVLNALQTPEPGSRAESPEPPRADDRLRHAVEQAERLATGVGRNVDDGDIAVALMDDTTSALGRAMAHLGITRERLEEALADTRPQP